jgi:hypothetical protein
MRDVDGVQWYSFKMAIKASTELVGEKSAGG